ncbi:hypothetical protein GCK32_013407, partial [Trichostrongylus colubriformis]
MTYASSRRPPLPAPRKPLVRPYSLPSAEVKAQTAAVRITMTAHPKEVKTTTTPIDISALERKTSEAKLQAVTTTTAPIRTTTQTNRIEAVDYLDYVGEPQPKVSQHVDEVIEVQTKEPEALSPATIVLPRIDPSDYSDYGFVDEKIASDFPETSTRPHGELDFHQVHEEAQSITKSTPGITLTYELVTVATPEQVFVVPANEFMVDNPTTTTTTATTTTTTTTTSTTPSTTTAIPTTFITTTTTRAESPHTQYTTDTTPANEFTIDNPTTTTTSTTTSTATSTTITTPTTSVTTTTTRADPPHTPYTTNITPVNVNEFTDSDSTTTTSAATTTTTTTTSTTTSTATSTTTTTPTISITTTTTEAHSPYTQYTTNTTTALFTSTEPQTFTSTEPQT